MATTIDDFWFYGDYMDIMENNKPFVRKRRGRKAKSRKEKKSRDSLMYHKAVNWKLRKQLECVNRRLEEKEEQLREAVGTSRELYLQVSGWRMTTGTLREKLQAVSEERNHFGVQVSGWRMTVEVLREQLQTGDDAVEALRQGLQVEPEGRDRLVPEGLQRQWVD